MKHRMTSSTKLGNSTESWRTLRKGSLEGVHCLCGRSRTICLAMIELIFFKPRMVIAEVVSCYIDVLLRWNLAPSCLAFLWYDGIDSALGIIAVCARRWQYTGRADLGGVDSRCTLNTYSLLMFRVQWTSRTRGHCRSGRLNSVHYSLKGGTKTFAMETSQRVVMVIDLVFIIEHRPSRNQVMFNEA